MNVSNRVARYLGTIQGAKSMSKEDLDKAIADQEQELVKLTSEAYAQVKTSLHQCVDAANASCTQCALDAKAKFETDHLGLSQIQRGLAQAVMKTENVKLTQSLKGKTGELDFDLTNFAKGSVQKAPERMNQFDACGQPKTKVTAPVNRVDPVKKKKEEVKVVTVPTPYYSPRDVSDYPVMVQDKTRVDRTYIDIQAKKIESDLKKKQQLSIKKPVQYLVYDQTTGNTRLVDAKNYNPKIHTKKLYVKNLKTKRNEYIDLSKYDPKIHKTTTIPMNLYLPQSYPNGFH